MISIFNRKTLVYLSPDIAITIITLLSHFIYKLFINYNQLSSNLGINSIPFDFSILYHIACYIIYYLLIFYIIKSQITLEKDQSSYLLIFYILFDSLYSLELLLSLVLTMLDMDLRYNYTPDDIFYHSYMYILLFIVKNGFKLAFASIILVPTYSLMLLHMPFSTAYYFLKPFSEIINFIIKFTEIRIGPYKIFEFIYNSQEILKDSHEINYRFASFIFIKSKDGISNFLTNNSTLLEKNLYSERSLNLVAMKYSFSDIKEILKEYIGLELESTKFLVEDIASNRNIAKLIGYMLYYRSSLYLIKIFTSLILLLVFIIVFRINRNKGVSLELSYIYSICLWKSMKSLLNILVRLLIQKMIYEIDVKVMSDFGGKSKIVNLFKFIKGDNDQISDYLPIFSIRDVPSLNQRINNL